MTAGARLFTFNPSINQFISSWPFCAEIEVANDGVLSEKLRLSSTPPFAAHPRPLSLSLLDRLLSFSLLACSFSIPLHSRSLSLLPLAPPPQRSPFAPPPLRSPSSIAAFFAENVSFGVFCRFFNFAAKSRDKNRENRNRRYNRLRHHCPMDLHTQVGVDITDYDITLRWTYTPR